jgi:hypothetical protein
VIFKATDNPLPRVLFSFFWNHDRKNLLVRPFSNVAVSSRNRGERSTSPAK